MRIFPTKVLLATDGSTDAILATRAAVDLARKTGSELHVVHAWQAPSPSLVSERYEPPRKEAARKLLHEQMERVEEAGGVVAEVHLLRGRPADVIVDLGEAVGAGLMVLG